MPVKRISPDEARDAHRQGRLRVPRRPLGAGVRGGPSQRRLQRPPHAHGTGRDVAQPGLHGRGPEGLPHRREARPRLQGRRALAPGRGDAAVRRLHERSSTSAPASRGTRPSPDGGRAGCRRRRRRSPATPTRACARRRDHREPRRRRGRHGRAGRGAGRAAARAGRSRRRALPVAVTRSTRLRAGLPAADALVGRPGGDRHHRRGAHVPRRGGGGAGRHRRRSPWSPAPTRARGRWARRPRTSGLR